MNYVLLFALYSREIWGLYVIPSYSDYRFTFFKLRVSACSPTPYTVSIILLFTHIRWIIHLLDMNSITSEHVMFIFHLIKYLRPELSHQTCLCHTWFSKQRANISISIIYILSWGIPVVYVIIKEGTWRSKHNYFIS